MLDKLLLLGLCLTGSLHAAPKEFASCEELCKSTFHGEELGGCRSGCNLMNVGDRIFIGMGDMNELRQRCDSLCQSSNGPSSTVVKACSQGCGFMVPSIQRRRQNLKLRNPFEMIFGRDNIFNQLHLPQVFPKDSKPEVSKEEEIPGMIGNFGGMFSNMRKIMNDMMEKLRSGEMGGNGKVVVIKARPGHYETETYDFSPKNALNDMMNKVNPLDDFFNPKKQELTQEEVENKNDNEDLFGVEFVKPINSNMEKDNEWVIEPILPETGLKSRIVHDGDICNRHPEYMSWSNYFYCVDKRISTSGWWIYICVLPLACLLLLRICMLMARRETDTLVPLTITSHKDMLAKAKEAEANASVISIVTIPDYEKGDLPPAYEDVTNLRVSLVPLNKEKEEEDNKNETKA